MINDILKGKTNQNIDNSSKSILVRGCDPEMAKRASKIVVPLLGNPKFVTSTKDEDFFAKLKKSKFDIVFFAPGACR